MDTEVAALASVAASTVVKLLATDGWQRAKTAIGALWRRVHPDREAAVDAELVETRAELLAAADGDPLLEQELAAEWQGRLRRLMVAHPDVVADVHALVTELRAALPGNVDSQSGPVQLRARATGHSRIYQAGRDLHVDDT